jgi:hypothetical protein
MDSTNQRIRIYKNDPKRRVVLNPTDFLRYLEECGLPESLAHESVEDLTVSYPSLVKVDVSEPGSLSVMRLPCTILVNAADHFEITCK